MTLFQLIKITLDKLYEQGLHEYGDALDAQIKHKMLYLSKSYENLSSSQRKPIDYRDPATRFAYVYCYVATHGDYIVQALERLRSQLDRNIFQDESTRVSCIGGGPGSDILAILKYLNEQPRESAKKLICYLLDREHAWADTWTEIDESLTGDLKLNTNFQPFDVTQPDTWRYQKNFLQADLFTLSYFVSEVYSFGASRSTLRDILEQAKPGALVLYLDNGHQIFDDYFDDIWADIDFVRLVNAPNEQWTPRYSEQTADIQTYIDKFDRSPKLRGNLSLRVLRKADV